MKMQILEVTRAEPRKAGGRKNPLPGCNIEQVLSVKQSMLVERVLREMMGRHASVGIVGRLWRECECPHYASIGCDMYCLNSRAIGEFLQNSSGNGGYG